MKLAFVIARVLLGLPFLVFGLNHFLEFMDQPEHPPEATRFLVALGESGYVWPVTKVFEIACGAMLVAGVFVPLALTVLAPILVAILGYHLALDPGGSAMAFVLVGLELFLVWAYREHFTGVTRMNAKPRGMKA